MPADPIRLQYSNRVCEPGPLGLPDQRLLLGNAVNIATAEQDFPPRHHNHPALGKHPLQHLQRLGIKRIIEAGRDNAVVDNQKVDVGSRQTNGRVTGLTALDRKSVV